MLYIKYAILMFIFIDSCLIGILVSRRYKNRVRDLKNFKSAINILQSKIKFTYEPLGDIFFDISEIMNKETDENVQKTTFMNFWVYSQENGMSALFKRVSENIKFQDTRIAWENAINDTKEQLYFNKEDLEIIKSFGNMLGKTDVCGQLNEINLTIDFLETQIKKSENECNKNEKLYKTLGTVIGLTIVIILI